MPKNGNDTKREFREKLEKKKRFNLDTYCPFCKKEIPKCKCEHAKRLKQLGIPFHTKSREDRKKEEREREKREKRRRERREQQREAEKRNEVGSAATVSSTTLFGSRFKRLE